MYNLLYCADLFLVRLESSRKCSRIETKGINGNCVYVVWTEIYAKSMEHKTIATTVTAKLIIPSFLYTLGIITK